MTDESIDLEEELSTDGEERDELTITVPLDPAHKRMDVALREEGVNVEQALVTQTAPSVEQALYRLLQQAKYGQQ